MTGHELLEVLSRLPNQEARIRLLIGNELFDIEEVWENSKPVVIVGIKQEVKKK